MTLARKFTCFASLAALTVLSAPATGQAFFQAGNGPFNPATDCGSWTGTYAGLRARACVYHSGSTVRHGFQAEATQATTTPKTWNISRRALGTTRVYYVGEYSEPAHNVTAGIYSIWLNATYASNICVQTMKEYIPDGPGATFSSSPWRQGASTTACP